MADDENPRLMIAILDDGNQSSSSSQPENRPSSSSQPLPVIPAHIPVPPGPFSHYPQCNCPGVQHTLCVHIPTNRLLTEWEAKLKWQEFLARTGVNAQTIVEHLFAVAEI